MANGILIIDKPGGWTSMDVCAKLRGILKTKKIGHAGTLDPMATGVLPVFVGQATRAVSFAESGRKEYAATLRLGQVTDTQDTTGETLETHPVKVSMDDLRAVLGQFTGDIVQIPPMFSAVKIGGQKLYDLARQGKTVERQPRPVTVYELEVTEQLSPTDFALRILCSKGTYVRTLCHDLGQTLGCGGCMSSLRRVEAGQFSVDQAVTLSQVQQMADAGRAEELLLPVDSLFLQYPRCTATAAQENKIRCGNQVKTSLSGGDYRVYAESGEFLMLGRMEDGIMKTVKSFFEV